MRSGTVTARDDERDVGDQILLTAEETAPDGFQEARPHIDPVDIRGRFGVT